MIALDGSLSVEEVVAVARDGERVELTADARERMVDSHTVIAEIVEADEESVYGVNTGFGNLKNVSIARPDLERLQLNLLRSHHAAVGDPVTTPVVRAALLCRANALAVGVSGVRPKLVKRLCDLLNADVHPVIPGGGSADNACELANVGLVLAGEGTVVADGERVDGDVALERAGIDPLTFGPKEGIALISGTPLPTAQTALAVDRLERLVTATDVAGAWTYALVGEEPGAFDERVFDVRPVDGHATSAANVRRLAAVTQSSRADMTQDPLSIRCLPQVNGSVRTFLDTTRGLVETELASATDNPLIFPDGTARSCGTFNAQHLATAADALRLATIKLGHASERRSNHLLSTAEARLTSHLATDPGLESGLGRVHYVAASLMTESEATGAASHLNYTASTGQEDLHAAGNVAGRNLLEVIEKIQRVVAIELLCCGRATQLGERNLPDPLDAVFETLDEAVALPTGDDAWADRIEATALLLQEGSLSTAIERTGVPIE